MAVPTVLAGLDFSTRKNGHSVFHEIEIQGKIRHVLTVSADATKISL
jgi:hypothetical protein